MENDTTEHKVLIQALSEPADYSNSFDQVVEQLRIKLVQALGAEVFRNGDMNYSSAQTIELWLGKAHEPVGTRSAALYGILIFISSKGHFCAIRCITQDAPRRWLPLPDGELDKNLEAYIQKTEQILATEGYVSLSRSVLSQKVEGHLTRLDKLPATVFQVLFSELG